jgi:hypothetical protein
MHARIVIATSLMLAFAIAATLAPTGLAAPITAEVESIAQRDRVSADTAAPAPPGYAAPQSLRDVAEVALSQPVVQTPHDSAVDSAVAIYAFLLALGALFLVAYDHIDLSLLGFDGRAARRKRRNQPMSSQIRHLLGVRVEPIEHALVPQHAVGGLEHPVIFVREHE